MSPPPGRMRAGVRRRCSHASCRCGGKALQLQCHVCPSREERPRSQPRTQAAPERNECPAAVIGSPLQEAPCRHVALQQPRGLPQDLRALAEREAHPLQLMVEGRRKVPAQERLAVQGQLCLGDVPWAVLPSEGRCPADQVLGERRLPRPPRRTPGRSRIAGAAGSCGTGPLRSCHGNPPLPPGAGRREKRASPCPCSP